MKKGNSMNGIIRRNIENKNANVIRLLCKYMEHLHMESGVQFYLLHLKTNIKELEKRQLKFSGGETTSSLESLECL